LNVIHETALRLLATIHVSPVFHTDTGIRLLSMKLVKSLDDLSFRRLSMKISYLVSPQFVILVRKGYPWNYWYHSIIHEKGLPYISQTCVMGIRMLSVKISYLTRGLCVIQVRHCFSWK